jgi:hypothetical protein
MAYALGKRAKGRQTDAEGRRSSAGPFQGRDPLRLSRPPQLGQNLIR